MLKSQLPRESQCNPSSWVKYQRNRKFQPLFLYQRVSIQTSPTTTGPYRSCPQQTFREAYAQYYLQALAPLALQQWGFRPKRSTVSALIDVTHRWLQSLDKGKEIYAVFFDLRKAFDLVHYWKRYNQRASTGVS